MQRDQGGMGMPKDDPAKDGGEKDTQDKADQLREALACGARMVLLDNMPLPTLHEAVRINAASPTPAILEISGGVTLSGLRALAETGVDRISIGTLTKDIQAIDYSMRFAPQP